MKKELKYIDELDSILHFLATTQIAKGYITAKEIINYPQSIGNKMTEERIIKILNKLSNDKYVEQEKLIRASTFPVKHLEITTYKITFDGLVQDEIGGYHSIYLENNKLKNIQKWQNRLTLFIAIGAFFTSIYYILEICKFFSNCN